jgi:hypothetical protein
MAIRNVVTGGLGLNNSVIGWILTVGFGALSTGGGGVPGTPTSQDISVGVRVGL